MTRALTLVLTMLTISATLAQTPARDAPPLAMAGTGSVAGSVVTDDDTRAPLRRATVTLSRSGVEDMRTTLTDDTGRFRYLDLPPGVYTLSVFKAGYVSKIYGALQPGMPGNSITVIDRQRFSAAPIALMRGGVITGRLLDPAGQPIAGSVVLAQPFTIVNGERRRRNDGRDYGTATNAHGEYRIFGLPPGDYVVYADMQGTQPARATSPAELAWADTPNTPSPPPGRLVVYAPTIYPGTPNPAAGVPIAIARGEERTGTDFAVQFVPVSTVSGTVTGPDGLPAAGVGVWRSPLQGDPLYSTAVSNVRTDENGRFRFPGVRPGTFVLLATGASSLWATAEVAVTDRDVSDVSLRLQAGGSMSGRAVFRSAMSTPAPDATRFGGSLMPASDVSRGQGAPGLRFQPDATFKIDGVVPGIYRLVMGTPNSATAGWTPRSAMLGGRDLLDTTFDVRAGEEISGVVLTYTDRMAGLAGTLVDSADRPAPQFYVFMFPSDRTFWTPGSRRIKSVRADVTGAYDITGLPPGEYYVCALTSLDPTQQNEPAYLEQFIAAAIRIALSDGEQRQQTLRIGG